MARLLIVEDNPELAENLSEILESEDHEVVVCESAERALERLRQERFEGILTDLRLPGQSGLELIERLRERADPTPIVLMTAYADASATRKAEKLGALAVVFKPIDMPFLFSLVSEFAPSERKVLIVEDNAEFAQNVAEALHARGFQPVVVGSVKEALAQHQLPYVALIDYRLPDGTGLDAARCLCARDPALRVVLVSGYDPQLTSSGASMPTNVTRTLAKPIPLVSLLETISTEAAARRSGGKAADVTD